MKLSNQPIGALMKALQKSLIEQRASVPLMADMSFEKAPGVQSWGGKSRDLMVANPPIVSLEGITPPFTIEEIEE